MQLSALLLLIASVTLSAVAQMAFKLGVSSRAPQITEGWLAATVGMLLVPGVLVGLTLYGIGTLVWLNALARVDLSQAYPFVGIGFALTTLAGWLWFGETLSAARLAGIGLILAGIVLVGRS